MNTKAYILPSGEIMYPKRLEAPGIIGDGWGFAEPHTPAYDAWREFSERATPQVVALAVRLKRAGQQKT